MATVTYKEVEKYIENYATGKYDRAGRMNATLVNTFVALLEKAYGKEVAAQKITRIIAFRLKTRLDTFDYGDSFKYTYGDIALIETALKRGMNINRSINVELMSAPDVSSLESLIELYYKDVINRANDVAFNKGLIDKYGNDKRYGIEKNTFMNLQTKEASKQLETITQTGMLSPEYQQKIFEMLKNNQQTDFVTSNDKNNQKTNSSDSLRNLISEERREEIRKKVEEDERRRTTEMVERHREKYEQALKQNAEEYEEHRQRTEMEEQQRKQEEERREQERVESEELKRKKQEEYENNRDARLEYYANNMTEIERDIDMSISELNNMQNRRFASDAAATAFDRAYDSLVNEIRKNSKKDRLAIFLARRDPHYLQYMDERFKEDADVITTLYRKDPELAEKYCTNKNLLEIIKLKELKKQTIQGNEEVKMEETKESVL